MKKLFLFICSYFFLINIQAAPLENNSDEFNISPNPFGTTVTFSFNILKPDTVSIVIFDRSKTTIATIINNKIYPIGKFDTTCNLSYLKPGKYIVMFIVGQNQVGKGLTKIDFISISEINSSKALSYQNKMDVQIIDQNINYLIDGSTEDFYYINSDFNLSKELKIASLRGICTNTGEQTLSQLFSEFWLKSNFMGANSFKIDSFAFNQSGNFCMIFISIYNLTDSKLDKNSILYPRNMIYVFGDLDLKKPRNMNVIINDITMTIAPLEYVSYQNSVDKIVTISKGGLTGSKVWIKGEIDMLSKYYLLGGGQIRPRGYNASSGAVGIAISTGMITKIDLNYGYFLATVLKENVLTP